MDSKDEIKKRLVAAGYEKIVEYNDPPHEFFADHDHEKDQVIYIFKGSMLVNMQGKEYSLKAGDELFFPAKVIHNAKIGVEGCEYFDGEKV